MATHTTLPPYLNGNRPSLAASPEHSDFYDKLFALQDAVFAGKHPRIRLPESTIRSVSSRAAQLTTPSSFVANNVPNGFHQPARAGDQQQPPGLSLTHAQSLAPPTPTFGRSASAKSSSIDPVLLTKSDDLVRAETVLKRQRIERALRDLHDSKRRETQVKDFSHEFETTLDVAEILRQAQEIVKPFSAVQDAAASDSFDENSYYSSKANSWSTDDASHLVDPQADAAAIAVDLDAGVNGDVDTSDGSADMLVDQQDVDGDDLDYEPALDIEMIEPPAANELPESDEGEDGEYSPPPVEVQPVQMPLQMPHLSAVNSMPIDTQSRRPRPHSPPSYARRNDIEQPLAPQPMRVSPLATAKGPRLNRGQNNRQGRDNRSRPNSPNQETGRNGQQQGRGRGNMNDNTAPSPRNAGRTSPNGNRNNGSNRRKRPREAEAAEQQSRRASGKRVALSPPAPIIKEEPVSPPPFSFSDLEPPRRRVHDDIEVISPREARMRPTYQRDREHRPIQYYEEPTSPTFMQPPSRALPRRVERDDQDLRRVASLQYARRPQSPIAAPYSEPRIARAVSHAHLEHAPSPYRAGSMRPQSSFVRDRSRSPPYADEGFVRTRTPLAMGPPPPRPFIVDEYGNKYYAAPVPVERPRQVYERASTREPPLRASTRVTELYDDDDGLSRMAPPPRRYVDQGDVEVIRERPYRAREYSVAAAPERRPVVVYDDMPPPPAQQYVTRAYSVRPEPVEYVTRQQSQAPGREYVRRAESVVQQPYREMSVYDSEGGAPRYARAVPQQQRRYVEEMEGDEMYESSRGGYRRYG